MSEITGAWVDEAPAITLKDIDRFKASIHDHIVHPVNYWQGSCYLMAVSAETWHELKCIQARQDWYDYYHSMRLLRRIRRNDVRRCEMFKKVFA